jgi:uncharacterized protein
LGGITDNMGLSNSTNSHKICKFVPMSREVIFETIKKTIHSYLPDARILLFGSRANGNYAAQSDYDLLIITPNILSSNDRLNWSSLLHKVIVKAIHAPVDLLLYSELDILEKQTLPGHIVRTVLKDGITL